MEFLKIIDETEDGFQGIANKLFNEYAIKTYDSLFRITKIEFYWDSGTHPDKSTYPRTYVNPSTGDWFFHYSGIDIALKNDKTGGHGGILIREIYDIKNKQHYKGPMVCVMRLFSGTNAFNDTIKTRIIEHKFLYIKSERLKRKNLGQNAKDSGTDKLAYGFSIKIPVEKSVF